MSNHSQSNTLRTKEEYLSYSQLGFSLSQETPAFMSQEMTEFQKLGDRLLRAGQSLLSNSNPSDLNGPYRNSQPDMYRLYSQDISLSQQTVDLSQNSSQGDPVRSDSLYQGYIYKMNQTQSQPLGYLLETLQSQSCEPALLEQSQKQQPVPNAFSCQPVIPAKPIVPSRPVKGVKRKSRIILLTPGKSKSLRLKNITIRRVRKKHLKKGFSCCKFDTVTCKTF